MPIGYAAFRRLYHNDRTDYWLWQGPCWHDKRFILLFVGITVVYLLPQQLATLFWQHGANSGTGVLTMLSTTVLSLLTLYYTTKAQFLALAIVTHDPDCRLQTALQRSKGHFWDLIFGQFCALVPVTVLTGLCFAALYPLMNYLARLGYVPLQRPIAYLPVYGNLASGLLGTAAFIAKMCVISAFYPQRPGLAEVF